VVGFCWPPGIFLKDLWIFCCCLFYYPAWWSNNRDCQIHVDQLFFFGGGGDFYIFENLQNIIRKLRVLLFHLFSLANLCHLGIEGCHFFLFIPFADFSFVLYFVRLRGFIWRKE